MAVQSFSVTRHLRETSSQHHSRYISQAEVTLTPHALLQSVETNTPFTLQIEERFYSVIVVNDNN